MPRGPNGEKRPADPVECAFMVVRIATGQCTEEPKPREPDEPGKTPVKEEPRT